MMLRIICNSKTVGFCRSIDELLSKIHPTEANKSYSTLASSSVSERLEEHQEDKKSAWETDIIAVRTLVWNHMQRIQSNL